MNRRPKRGYPVCRESQFTHHAPVDRGVAAKEKTASRGEGVYVGYTSAAATKRTSHSSTATTSPARITVGAEEVHHEGAEDGVRYVP